ncbi:MAG: hypothetical protein JJ978_09460 [Roseivirga sp.]|jgi:hypothetical protein|uniref:hypothetical protein n=1 Tax=Roseivirga sp. TaxID=1964215 RepID=UPI001B2BD91A|nr:hypothetical protein [Roseivirga sp.]MBO6495782.1 hypothetical protein [Roseivirga sp.]
MKFIKEQVLPIGFVEAIQISGLIMGNVHIRIAYLMKPVLFWLQYHLGVCMNENALAQT